MADCIVTYAARGRENYPSGIPRLVASLRDNFKGEIIAVVQGAHMGHIPAKVLQNFDGLPSHQSVPYGFKPAVMQYAFSQGYDRVAWLDSTIVALKPLDALFDRATELGVAAYDNPGCPQCFWTSDDALDAMGCPRDAMFYQIMACALAIDIKNPVGKEVFEEWSALSRDGVTFQGYGRSSRPDFKAHRHDQSAMSFLLHKRGIKPVDYGELVYGSDSDKFPSAILANKALGT